MGGMASQWLYYCDNVSGSHMSSIRKEQSMFFGMALDSILFHYPNELYGQLQTYLNKTTTGIVRSLPECPDHNHDVNTSYFVEASRIQHGTSGQDVTPVTDLGESRQQEVAVGHIRIGMVGDHLPGFGEIVEIYQSSGQDIPARNESILHEFLKQPRPVKVFRLGRVRFQLSSYDRILVTALRGSNGAVWCMSELLQVLSYLLFTKCRCFSHERHAWNGKNWSKSVSLYFNTVLGSKFNAVHLFNAVPNKFRT